MHGLVTRVPGHKVPKSKTASRQNCQFTKVPLDKNSLKNLSPRNFDIEKPAYTQPPAALNCQKKKKTIKNFLDYITARQHPDRRPFRLGICTDVELKSDGCEAIILCSKV